MDDNSLAGYIPAYGDRIAARRFCLENQSNMANEQKKCSLLEKLKKKMGISENQEASDHDNIGPSKRKRNAPKNNKYAEKKTRRVELGWIHNGKQVQKRKGGGTRTIDVPKESKKIDILTYAKDLFFPKGNSKFGSLDTFCYDILDYQEESVLDDDVSIGEFYTILKMGILRFYLCTRSPEGDDDDLEVKSKAIQKETSNDKSKVTEENEYMNETIVLVSADLEETFADVSDTSEVMCGPFFGEPMASQFDDTLPMQESFLQYENDEPVITSVTATQTNAPPSTQSISAGVEDNNTAAPVDIVCVTIKVHRVNLLDEMISQFKDPVLLKLQLKFTYINEQGADADGVSRDVYAAFWEEFMDHTAEGEELRVPSLSPKWQEEEWKSIGRILVKGFQDYGYFPTRLSPACAVAIIFGEHEVSTDMLFESLLMYLSQTERDLLTTAITEELSGEDRDDLLDLLDRMGVTSLPAKDNLKGIFLQVAHKQIIQKPRYALEKISLTAGETLQQMFHSPQDVQNMYEEKKPTTKKLLKLLNAIPKTQAESQSYRFLQQYIRGLDDVGLRKMLRFVTGSDVVCVNQIEILFTSLEGLARRPVSHTCGPVLELPSTYLSYPELRVEMDNVLFTKNAYEFTIV